MHVTETQRVGRGPCRQHCGAFKHQPRFETVSSASHNQHQNVSPVRANNAFALGVDCRLAQFEAKAIGHWLEQCVRGRRHLDAAAGAGRLHLRLWACECRFATLCNYTLLLLYARSKHSPATPCSLCRRPNCSAGAPSRSRQSPHRPCECRFACEDRVST